MPPIEEYSRREALTVSDTALKLGVFGLTSEQRLALLKELNFNPTRIRAIGSSNADEFRMSLVEHAEAVGQQQLLASFLDRRSFVAAPSDEPVFRPPPDDEFDNLKGVSADQLVRDRVEELRDLLHWEDRRVGGPQAHFLLRGEYFIKASTERRAVQRIFAEVDALPKFKVIIDEMKPAELIISRVDDEKAEPGDLFEPFSRLVQWCDLRMRLHPDRTEWGLFVDPDVRKLGSSSYRVATRAAHYFDNLPDYYAGLVASDKPMLTIKKVLS